MGLGQFTAPSRWCLALYLLHLEYHPTWNRHYDLFVRRLPRQMEQDAARHWSCSDADSRVPHWMGHVNLLGMAHPTDGH